LHRRARRRARAAGAAAVEPAPPGFADHAAKDTLIVPLEEVVVAGTRVPEVARDVPGGLSVVPRARFENASGLSLKEALGFVPGVFVQSRAGNQDVRITIRGFGARGNGDRSNAGNLRGIRVMTDGIPVTEPDGRTSLDLVDLGTTDRVEISRSNASAVYGNASGGVVNLRTNLDFDTPYLVARSRGGSYGFHREQVMTGFAAGRARGTFSLTNSTLDGWRDHSAASATLAQMRFAVPLDDDTRLGLLLDGASNLTRFPGALTAAEAAADPAQADPVYVSRNDRRRNRIGRIATTLDRRVGTAQNVALTLYTQPMVLERSERNRYRDFTRYQLGGSATWDWTRALAPGLTSRFSLGGDDQFQDGAILFYTLGPGGSRGTGLVANKREAANSAGGFVQGELRWNERWSLRLGGRYDNLWYIAQDHIDPTLDATKRFTRWTPKASLAWLGGEHTVYTSLGGGVEAPAFNEIDPPPPFDATTSLNPFLEPMHSTSVEVGARGVIRPAPPLGRVGYDIALYWIDVRNDLVPYDGGAYFLTAGKSRRRGLELGLGWDPLERLALTGSLTLSENEYLEYVNDLGDFSGRQVAGLPRAWVNAAAELNVAPGLTANVDVESVGGYDADDANGTRTLPYTLLGATLAWVPPRPVSNLRAFISGRNLTDERYAASVFINGVSDRFFEPGLPRHWVAGVEVALRR